MRNNGSFGDKRQQDHSGLPTWLSRICRRFWSCERGEVYSASVILLTTVIAIGGVVGLTAYRDQLVQELGDLAAALTHLDQSYSTAIGEYVDDGPLLSDPTDAAPSGIDFGP